MDKKGFDTMKWIRSVRDKNARKLLNMSAEERIEYFRSVSRENCEEMGIESDDASPQRSDTK